MQPLLKFMLGDPSAHFISSKCLSASSLPNSGNITLTLSNVSVIHTTLKEEQKINNWKLKKYLIENFI